MHNPVESDTDLSNSSSTASQMSTKKLGLFTVAFLIFLIGYSIAPDPIDQGTYQIELKYRDNLFSFPIYINNSISDPNSPKLTDTIGVNENYTIRYFESYPGVSGTILTFSLTIEQGFEGHKLEISDFHGIISNQNLKYDFYVTKISGNTATYEFKLLKDTRIAMGLLFAVAFLWLGEVIPLGATSLLIPVVLVFTETETAKDSLIPFADPIIFLFLGGFLMAEAMKRSKLDQFVSYRLIAAIPPNAKLLMISFMFLTAGFSMFMSNTAAVAIFIPLATQLLKEFDEENDQYKRTVVLGIAYAATVGGIGSLIGTPPNILATEFLANNDPSIQISFLDWFFFGLPIVIIMVPIISVYLWLRFKPHIEANKLRESKEAAKKQIRENHGMTKDQIIVSSVFILVFGLWLSSEIHNVSASIIALLGAFLLFIFGQIKEEDFKNVNWNALLTFGGGLSLGFTLLKTGLADFIGTRLIGLRAYPQFVIILIIGFTALVVTAVASNTSSAVILVPIVIPLGPILGINPIILAVTVAIVASVDFAIVIGTPPTMMAYSTGLYKVKDIFKLGIVLDLIGLLVCSITAYFLYDHLLQFV